MIDQLDWNRNDLRGATRQELRRMDVEARLSPYIDAVNECVPFVDPRFVIDLEYAREAIQRAKDAIDEWKRARA